MDEVVQRNIDAFSNPLEASDDAAQAGKKGKGSAFSLLPRSKQSGSPCLLQCFGTDASIGSAGLNRKT